ncbi:efflux RND transporter periplasmic adaptor subunit [Azohydromonas lata]|uniref:Efflux RND transporter periplasmic adaptor subunit n=1 Tax=Azohydromonas lata TaxID=45677 RepID=A0ABU5IQX6_9BURK|nr:efflux RND transporter periplasmic adaptor subunit [Azohydromonas lata]MDZ5461282.1 efflux RND transporter periplasmic adaptor subunit [Azohydromonas lata]
MKLLHSLRRRPAVASLSVAVAALVLGTAGTALTGLGASQAEPPAAAAAPAAVAVSVAEAAEREVTTWETFSGRLEAVQRVELRPRVAGAVQAVHFREGALVKAGDLLFTLDPAPYAAEVERAQAQLAAAQARLAQARSEQQRAERLWEERAVAQREFDERSHGLREAEANLRAAQASLQAAQLSLQYTQVRAPLAGRIGRVEVTPGNLVAAGPGAPVLATLVSVSPIYASFDADEQVVARVLADAGAGALPGRLERVPVRMEGPASAEGRLQLVDNQVDARSGTVRLRAVFDNRDGSLMPGQFARLQMGQPRSASAVLVSERAVGTDQDKRFVIVVGPDNKAVWREVQLGAVVDGLRIVTQGLRGGERVVVNGLHRVRPGTLVAPQPVAMQPQPQRQASGDAAAAGRS